MAWHGATLVGSCWTKVHADGVGEIYIIGLRPDYHGRGWGKALALEGLRHLAESKKCSRGMLYVDAANPIALATYERIGFRTMSMDRSYINTA
jgi:mycothiol synthase